MSAIYNNPGYGWAWLIGFACGLAFGLAMVFWMTRGRR
jgi:hypothetical protein